jgi:hypothetical protein
MCLFSLLICQNDLIKKNEIIAINANENRTIIPLCKFISEQDIFFNKFYTQNYLVFSGALFFLTYFYRSKKEIYLFALYFISALLIFRQKTKRKINDKIEKYSEHIFAYIFFLFSFFNRRLCYIFVSHFLLLSLR